MRKCTQSAERMTIRLSVLTVRVSVLTVISVLTVRVPKKAEEGYPISRTQVPDCTLITISLPCRDATKTQQWNNEGHVLYL